MKLPIIDFQEVSGGLCHYVAHSFGCWVLVENVIPYDVTFLRAHIHISSLMLRRKDETSRMFS